MRLGITTILRDRAPWIKEWIAYHYLVGFRKFYLHLDRNTDNSEEVINSLKKSFDIVMFNIPADTENRQMVSYQYSCDNFLKEVDWMAIIDSDEFIVPLKTGSINEVLSEFQDKPISALALYWAIFGSSGFIKEPSGLIIENYKKRAVHSFEPNRHIKSIIKGKDSQAIGMDPHFFKTALGTFDERLWPILSGLTNYEPSYNKIRINHYICQSREYFEKFKKGTRGPDNGDLRDEKWWEENNRNEVKDDSMERFIKPLKELLGSL